MKTKIGKIVAITIGIIILVSGIFLSSIEAYDYKSNISSNNPLYYFDLLNERIALVFALPDRQIRLAIKYMDERSPELDKVSKESEINKIISAFNYLYNYSQKKLSKISNNEKRVDYQKKIISSNFSLLESVSKKQGNSPEKIIENISLSIDSLPDNEKSNVIKENADKIKAIAKNAPEIISQMKKSLPQEVADDIDDNNDDSSGSDDDSGDNNEVEDTSALLGMTAETAFSLDESEIGSIDNIESVNVIVNKGVVSVMAIIDQRDPAYQEVIEEDLVLIFKYYSGKFNKIGSYQADTIDSDAIIGRQAEIKALNLSTDELHWLIFNQKDNSIVDFY